MPWSTNLGNVFAGGSCAAVAAVAAVARLLTELTVPAFAAGAALEAVEGLESAFSRLVPVATLSEEAVALLTPGVFAAAAGVVVANVGAADFGVVEADEERGFAV